MTLSFLGFDLEMTVDHVIARGDDLPAVFTGVDFTGQDWLVVLADPRADHLAWLCAPITSRMRELLEDGRAAAADLLHHSCSGWIELVSVEVGRAVPERSMACAQIPTGWSAGQPLWASRGDAAVTSQLDRAGAS